MKPTVLYFGLNEIEVLKLRAICFNLHIETKEIRIIDGMQKMGYLLGCHAFSQNSRNVLVPFKKPLIYFASMSQKEVYDFIDTLKEMQLHIAYKCMQTPTNLNYTFIELYEHIQQEDELMKGKKNG